KQTTSFGIPGIAFCAALSHDESQLYFGSSDFRLYRIDLTADKPKAEPFGEASHGSYVTGMARAGEFLITGGYDCTLAWWRLDDGRRERTVENAHSLWIRDVAASPDGRSVATVADDMLCHVWDVASGERRFTLKDHAPETPHHYPSMLYALNYSPDGRLLATADRVGHVAIWDAESGEKLGSVEAPKMYTWDPRARRHSIGGARSVAFSPDNRLLAVGGIGQIGNVDHLGAAARIEVFDWKAGRRVHEIESSKFKGLVERLVFHPSGAWFVAAGGDHGGFVSVYDSETAKPLKEEKAPMHVHELLPDSAWSRLFAVGHERAAFWSLTG
ncbi:MAG: hypothetical protein D6725_05585, partial [Planctomycetota bacterium]